MGLWRDGSVDARAAAVSPVARLSDEVRGYAVSRVVAMAIAIMSALNVGCLTGRGIDASPLLAGLVEGAIAVIGAPRMFWRLCIGRAGIGSRGVRSFIRIRIIARWRTAIAARCIGGRGSVRCPAVSRRQAAIRWLAVFSCPAVAPWSRLAESFLAGQTVAAVVIRLARIPGRDDNAFFRVSDLAADERRQAVVIRIAGRSWSAEIDAVVALRAFLAETAGIAEASWRAVFVAIARRIVAFHNTIRDVFFAVDARGNAPAVGR